jgi:hypothetical protein
MRDISYILEQYTQIQPSSYFLEWPNARTALAVLHSLITFCCCCVYCGAPSPFDSLCFDRLSTCLVPDSFLQCKPFLEESPKGVQRPR